MGQRDKIQYVNNFSGSEELEFGNCLAPGCLTTGSDQAGVRGVASDT